MENQKERLSYALGMFLHSNLKNQSFEDLDYDTLAQAMKDSDSGTLIMTPQDANGVIQGYQQGIQKKKAEAGQQFLVENAKKEGVTTTASGLQYKVLKAGNGGAKPTASNTVTVHYEGRLLNGKVFDSSYKRGEKISFGLGQVIKGWTEGVQLMEIGAQYEFYIPYNLAYGDQGAGADIPPYATLIFVVELFEFK